MADGLSAREQALRMLALPYFARIAVAPRRWGGCRSDLRGTVDVDETGLENLLPSSPRPKLRAKAPVMSADVADRTLESFSRNSIV